VGLYVPLLANPGRVLGRTNPTAHLLALSPDQLRINPKSFEDYGTRDETRVSTSPELQPSWNAAVWSRRHRTMARIAFNESIGTDRGDAIVGAMWSICGTSLFSSLRLRCSKDALPHGAALEAGLIRR